MVFTPVHGSNEGGFMDLNPLNETVYFAMVSTPGNETHFLKMSNLRQRPWDFAPKTPKGMENIYIFCKITFLACLKSGF